MRTLHYRHYQMAKRIVTGIDIGTYQVKVVVAEQGKNGARRAPKILGTGTAESRGLRHGYIVSGSEITKSIRTAVAQTEKSSGVAVRRAYISVGGVGLDEVRARGEAVVARGDSEVTDLDIEKALKNAEGKAAAKLVNRRIIHIIPLGYALDGEYVFGRLEGLHGTKIEVEVLFITCFEQHLNDLITAVEEAGVAVDDVMASPMAGSLVTLSKADKVAGCVLTNIGSETASIVVFEHGLPISLKVFALGSRDVTNDIALGLKVSPEEAERIKLGAITGANYTRKKLDEIILARLSDIFELIEAHLKKIGKSGLLPAGIIITGGGAGVATIEDLAKAVLRLPSKVAQTSSGDNARVRDSSWAVAYGLCMWGLNADEDTDGIQMAKQTGGTIASWIKQFLP